MTAGEMLIMAALLRMQARHEQAAGQETHETVSLMIAFGLAVTGFARMAGLLP